MLSPSLSFSQNSVEVSSFVDQQTQTIQKYSKDQVRQKTVMNLSSEDAKNEITQEAARLLNQKRVPLSRITTLLSRARPMSAASLGEKVPQYLTRSFLVSPSKEALENSSYKDQLVVRLGDDDKISFGDNLPTDITDQRRKLMVDVRSIKNKLVTYFPQLKDIAWEFVFYPDEPVVLVEGDSETTLRIDFELLNYINLLVVAITDLTLSYELRGYDNSALVKIFSVSRAVNILMNIDKKEIDWLVARVDGSRKSVYGEILKSFAGKGTNSWVKDNSQKSELIRRLVELIPVNKEELREVLTQLRNDQLVAMAKMVFTLSIVFESWSEERDLNLTRLLKIKPVGLYNKIEQVNDYHAALKMIEQFESKVENGTLMYEDLKSSSEERKTLMETVFILMVRERKFDLLIAVFNVYVNSNMNPNLLLTPLFNTLYASQRHYGAWISSRQLAEALAYVVQNTENDIVSESIKKFPSVPWLKMSKENRISVGKWLEHYLNGSEDKGGEIFLSKFMPAVSQVEFDDDLVFASNRGASDKYGRLSLEEYSMLSDSVQRKKKYVALAEVEKEIGGNREKIFNRTGKTFLRNPPFPIQLVDDGHLRTLKIDFEIFNNRTAVYKASLGEIRDEFYLQNAPQSFALKKLFALVNFLDVLVGASVEEKKFVTQRAIQSQRYSLAAFLSHFEQEGYEREPWGNKKWRKNIFEILKESFPELNESIESLELLDSDVLRQQLSDLENERKTEKLWEHLAELLFEDILHSGQFFRVFDEIVSGLVYLKQSSQSDRLEQFLTLLLQTHNGRDKLFEAVHKTLKEDESRPSLDEKDVAEILLVLEKLLKSSLERGVRFRAHPETKVKYGLTKEIFQKIKRHYEEGRTVVEASSLGKSYFDPATLNDRHQMLVIDLNSFSLTPYFSKQLIRFLEESKNKQIQLLVSRFPQIAELKKEFKALGIQDRELKQIQFIVNPLISSGHMSELSESLEKWKMNLSSANSGSATDIAFVSDFDLLERLQENRIHSVALDRVFQEQRKELLDISNIHGAERHAAIGTLFNLSWQLLSQETVDGLSYRLERDGNTGIYVARLEFLREAIQDWLSDFQSKQLIEQAA